MEFFTGPHMLFIAVIVIVLFGGSKLPELGKGLGEGLKGFKDGLKGGSDEPKPGAVVGTTAHTVTPTAKQEADTILKP